ncbi:MAG: DUF4395 domain-containing protein [Marinilabiliales bacterium]|nr:DUF4395 domain-containing protein [Marinilabiliales bacterium]
MGKIFQFGEIVEGYRVPVLNEREVRASAGIMFFFAYTSLLLILFKGNFVPAKFFVFIFLCDFAVRVLINPRFSPTLILGRWIVQNQRPEYVGAPQKKFAWWIGLFLAGSMFILLVVLNTYSIITGLICLICLIFLFFESVFGICLGCLFYNFFYKEEASYCPGYTCEVSEREEIQKIKASQWLIMAGFVLFVYLSIHFLTATFKERPSDLWVKYGLKKEAPADPHPQN